MNDLFLRACRREPVERPPVWMMRQAGRYLPEYRAVRAKSDFLSMCRTPDLAVEVTLQPVDIMKVDAAIIFSDILVIPEAMGMELIMDEGKGPQFPSPLRSTADVNRLKTVEPGEDLGYVLEAIKLARHELDGRVPLIGFAGAPWTLAAYMVEGKGTKQFQVAKKMLMEDAPTAHILLSKLAVAVGFYLKAQVKAGAQAIQLFDSWAGALAPEEFRQFALPYLAEAATIARSAGAPLIVFAPGAGWAMEEIAEATKADVIGVDWHSDAADMRRRADAIGVAVQGNLDPCALYASRMSIRERTRRMLDAFAGPGHIANLGHGILPDIPVDHAKAFIDTVREYRAAPAAQFAGAGAAERFA
jgi:uroporphyrinogen decarboxylase